jgi:serine/threonine protein kinase
MLSAHCPNITSLFGIFHDEGNSIYGPSIGLITHYMLHGDLERFLGIPGNQVHGPRLVRCRYDAFGNHSDSLYMQAKGVAQAVEFIHEVSILHADIKPVSSIRPSHRRQPLKSYIFLQQNIFVDGDGNARLGDFGNAMFHPASPISAHDFGSPLYRAPEHIRAASPRNAMLVGEGNDMHQEFQKISHTFEMDVWSLGIVLLWVRPVKEGSVCMCSELTRFSVLHGHQAMEQRRCGRTPRARGS